MIPLHTDYLMSPHENSPLNAMKEELLTELYKEQDETILACLAAGIPAHSMRLTQPELVTKGYTVNLTSSIVFV